MDFSQQQILRDAEAYCKTLPKVYVHETFSYQPDLESQIDDLFEAWLKVKADKKFEKEMEKGILYGKNKKIGYTIVAWNVPIKAMLMTANGKEIIRKKILDIKQGGDEVFNTNIPAELFN